MEDETTPSTVEPDVEGECGAAGLQWRAGLLQRVRSMLQITADSHVPFCPVQIGRPGGGGIAAGSAAFGPVLLELPVPLL